MHITITGRHLEMTDALKEYIEHKLKHLDDKYFLKIVECHVIAGVEKFRQAAEIVIVGKHLKVSGKDETTDLYTSVNGAFAKIEGQLKRYKDKLKEHKMKENQEAAEETQ